MLLIKFGKNLLNFSVALKESDKYFRLYNGCMHPMKNVSLYFKHKNYHRKKGKTHNINGKFKKKNQTLPMDHILKLSYLFYKQVFF